MTETPQTVAIAGLGAIGGAVARALLSESIPGLALTAVSARDVEKAQTTLGPDGADVSIQDLNIIAQAADIVIECLPSTQFDVVVRPAIDGGKTVIVLSVAALLDRPELFDRAKETGANLVVPSGAILALDAVKAAAEGTIHSARVVTRKPPKSLVGAPYITAQGLDLPALTEPLLVFDGPVREGAKHFPANVNVAAAVALAGLGPDQTMLQVWADPGLERNQQTVEIDADTTRFTATIESIPDPNNPRTSRFTPQSVIATLRRLSGAPVVGT